MHRVILAATLAVLTLGATVGATSAQVCGLVGTCDRPTWGSGSGSTGSSSSFWDDFTRSQERAATQERLDRIESTQRTIQRDMQRAETQRETCRGMAGSIVAGIFGC